jgi:hypothetical protein
MNEPEFSVLDYGSRIGQADRDTISEHEMLKVPLMRMLTQYSSLKLVAFTEYSILRPVVLRMLLVAQEGPTTTFG